MMSCSINPPITRKPGCRHTSVLLLPLFLTGCGVSPADVVASTQHCSVVRVSPDVMVRLSRYYGSGDSVPLRVVQACLPGGGCTALMTYFHAEPPLVSMSGDGTLLIELLGGQITDVHSREVRTGSTTTIPVTIRQIRSRAPDDAAAELRRFRLARARGGLSDVDCDRAIDTTAS